MPTLRRPTVTLHYDDDGPRDAPAVVLAHAATLRTLGRR